MCIQTYNYYKVNGDNLLNIRKFNTYNRLKSRGKQKKLKVLNVLIS